jgi:alpha-tubulin suppressor-like RCC1 family protein
MAVLAGLFWAQGICAMPRPPWPPYPEKAPLYQETFDEYYFAGERNSELLIAGIGTLEESWSGYALQRTGDVIPFVVPAVDSTGYTNVTCDTGGSLRLWLRPYWSSESVTNGSSPGTTATVLELDAVSGGESALAWSLQISADGNTLGLFAETGSGLQEVLQAPIAWQAGQSHCLVLDYGPYGTMFYVDGSVAAQGAGLPSIPVSVGQLVIGSTLAGTNTAGADFDEFFSFNRLLTAFDVGMYYQWYSGQAALGPISDEEQARWGQRRRGTQMASILSPGNVYDPDQDSGCPTGGPVYITNLVPSVDAYSNVLLSMDIQGGTNGVLYDIYSTTNLSGAPFPSGWNWICQVETCNSYILSNQPPNAAFYVPALPRTTLVVGWGDDTYGECDVPSGLTNAIAVAGGIGFSLALLDNGSVIGWGSEVDEAGELAIPSGITNATAIAASFTHAVALLANGSVETWGQYESSDGPFVDATNYPPPSSNVVAIAAGLGSDLALLSNGTMVAWGPADEPELSLPSGLTNVQAIAAGYYFDCALLSNGIVKAWGESDPFYGSPANVPSDLTNVVAISAAGYDAAALRSDGTVEAWGWNEGGQNNVPAGLSNVVAISVGEGWQELALLANGTVVAWGDTNGSYGETPFILPSGLAGVKAIAAGDEFGLAILSSPSPVIFEQPASQSIIVGGNVTLTAGAAALTGFQYQWEFNGIPLTGQTNDTLSLTNLGALNGGSYTIIASNGSGSASSTAILTVILPPQIDYTYTTPGTSGTIWCAPITGYLNADITNVYPSPYLYYSQWQFNGTNISHTRGINSTVSYNPTNDGMYSIVISNAAGSTNLTWNVLLAAPGMMEAWGSDTNGECDRPATLTNAAAIAAGDYHSVAVTDSGSVLQWGKYSDGTNFYPVGSPPALTNVVAVAASIGHDIALKADGTVTNWGLTNDVANFVPTNLQPTKAIAAGWNHNVALLTNGTVFAWGDNTYGQTNVPGDLTNATAVAAGKFHSLALRADGTVEAWGCNTNGQTNVPSGLSNVVAIAAGGQHSLALTSDGFVVAWGYGQTNVPSGMSNVMAIAAGDDHSVALKNDGTLEAWGDNSSGQTNVPAEQPATVITSSGGLSPTFQTNTYPPLVVKLIAAGGNHSMAAIWSPLVQYPVDVSKDLLLIYNSTNTSLSSNVCAYYLAHRPMVSNANVLGISCATNEIIQMSDYTNTFSAPILNWLSTNPTKRPQYVILFQDLPSRLWYGSEPVTSVQYDMNIGYNPVFQTSDYLPSWTPFVTAINMNGTNGATDCTAYIDKLANMASFGSNSPGQLFISATARGYGNTNWYFDFADPPPTEFSAYAINAEYGVTNIDPTASVFGTGGNYANGEPIITTLATNVAGYFTCGWDCGGDYNLFDSIPPVIQFYGQSGWYIMTTVDSFDGQRDTDSSQNDFVQANFLSWFTTNSFGGTNYSNTPVGAVTTVEEPYPCGKVSAYVYYGDWAAGKSFTISAWAAQAQGNGCVGRYFQAVGDPFVRK